MDKYEYRAKTEQMLAYAEQKSYQKAMSIADTIDWRKVKNTAMLSTVSEIYENAGELGKARDTLFIAYDKAPSSRKVVYRLGIISLKLGHFDEAADCYEEFVKLAPKDPNQYILRYKILKAQNESNVALAFDEVVSANKEKIRELLQKKNIVYIYHNQVDARGDKPASENEVFTACSEAIEEIYKLIKKLTGYISAPKFFITADHGFLYKRDKLQEFDKVSYDREICAYSNKRFLLTTKEVREPGMKSRLMTYMNNLYVTTPIGADIFKVAGGGQNYVHGGSSLQEMLIPVIELTTNTRAVAYDYVDVILTSVNRKVTNLITYFDFIQTEKVTDTMKARSLVAYFTTEDGEKISFDVPIVANSREDAPEKRTFHEKFTLKSREYKYGDKYYLVLADANNEKNILQQYEFMIDIAFVDDFGF